MSRSISFFVIGFVICTGPTKCLPAVTMATSAMMDQKTGVLFKTSNTTLQRLFNEAEAKARWNRSAFGKYRVLVEGAGYDNVWLETQPMGGYMYAKRNLETARNNIQIFIDFQNKEGRFPGMISYVNNSLVPHYGWFQGYCFPMPAFELYYWLHKDQKYLEQLYEALARFDDYLWKTRDSDHDGCLESWCICDTGEDHCVRFNGCQWAWPFDVPPTMENIYNAPEDELKKCGISKKDTARIAAFPTPLESMDVMSYSYTGRDVLAHIARLFANGQESYWRAKAEHVRAKIKSYLWDPKRHACYDRDKNNRVMDVLLHNNLRCMYFGSFDQQMADEFVKYHLMNPDEFWTPMPLPSIAANDPAFRNISGNNWSGQPQGLTFQRSIRALENYGHYAELTLIARKFLKTIGDSLKFTQQFEPFTGVINNTSDGYGPSILATLEFISRLYGIHISQDKVYWSCLDDEQEYDYTQIWGDYTFRITSKGHQVFCTINGKPCFSFSKGIRVVSDLNGDMLELIGLEPKASKAFVTVQGNSDSMNVAPNAMYIYNGKWALLKQVPFYMPTNR